MGDGLERRQDSWGREHKRRTGKALGKAGTESKLVLENILLALK